MHMLFPQTDDFIAAALDSSGPLPSLVKRAVELRDAKEASRRLRLPDTAARAGAYGGILKTWRAMLVDAITRDVLVELGMDTARTRVKDLQTEIFGRARSSRALKSYAVSSRSGGGRAAPAPEVPESVRSAALAKFRSNEDGLRIAVEALRPTDEPPR